MRVVVGAPAFERGAVDALDAEALRATLSAADLAQARPSPDTLGARLALPLSQVKPARCQPMVPLRSATTLLGTPALISDCAPMMLRVRPAQLTTTSVSGEGAMSCTRSTSSAPGTLVAVGIETRWIFVERPAVEHHHVGAAAHQAVELLGADARRAAVVLDEFAERLARHVDAGEQLEAGLLPGRDAAVEIGEVGVAGARREFRPRARPGRRRRRTARCGWSRRGTSRAKRSSSRLSGTERAHSR